MKNLLVIDDDKTFCNVLANALNKKGFAAKTAFTPEEAITNAQMSSPEYVVLDLKIGTGSGLSLIPKLLAVDEYTKIVVLTGYANINTAVEAIKLGAVHYLSKPVDVEEILEAFQKSEGNPDAPLDDELLPLNKMEWQYIKSALDKNNHNISATARELKMHRRTLQRKIDKMPTPKADK